MNLLYVAFGGACGSSLRYLLSLLPIKGTFPTTTLLCNFLGAFFIGLVAGFAARAQLSKSSVLFLKTGLCGGFTTFSTFSLESIELIRSGQEILAILYIATSLILCLAGVAFGLLLTRSTT